MIFLLSGLSTPSWRWIAAAWIAVFILSIVTAIVLCSRVLAAARAAGADRGIVPSPRQMGATGILLMTARPALAGTAWFVFARQDMKIVAASFAIIPAFFGIDLLRERRRARRGAAAAPALSLPRQEA